MNTPVMINGLPGNMGKIVTETALERNLNVVPWSLTGEVVAEQQCQVQNLSIQLLKPSQRESQIKSILASYPNLIAIDYTHPSAVNENGEFYVKHGIPFVMGTTGGDRQALMTLVQQNRHSCVIAPNMAKQIVAFQAMIEHLAESYPTAFDGYKLSIVESHQKTKADTSGTAKAVAASFKKMGLNCEESQIQLIRQEDQQIQLMGVPQEYLGGHAFHTYSLDSADGTVHFEFQHNVCGRKVYAQGTIDAVIFLAEQIRQGNSHQCFSMMDILRAGAMG